MHRKLKDMSQAAGFYCHVYSDDRVEVEFSNTHVIIKPNGKDDVIYCNHSSPRLTYDDIFRLGSDRLRNPVMVFHTHGGIFNGWMLDDDSIDLLEEFYLDGLDRMTIAFGENGLPVQEESRSVGEVTLSKGVLVCPFCKESGGNYFVDDCGCQKKIREAKIKKERRLGLRVFEAKMEAVAREIEETNYLGFVCFRKGSKINLSRVNAISDIEIAFFKNGTPFVSYEKEALRDTSSDERNRRRGTEDDPDTIKLRDSSALSSRVTFTYTNGKSISEKFIEKDDEFRESRRFLKDMLKRMLQNQI